MLKIKIIPGGSLVIGAADYSCSIAAKQSDSNGKPGLRRPANTDGMAQATFGTGIGAVVIDIGSSMTRAGFAGEDSPRVICPSVVGVYVDETGTRQTVVEMDAIGWARPDLQVRRHPPMSGVHRRKGRKPIHQGLTRADRFARSTPRAPTSTSGSPSDC